MTKRRFRSGVLVSSCLLVVAALAGGLLAQGGPSGPTDPQQRLKWFEQHQAMKGRSPFKDFRWQFLGPTNVSGRVTDVAVPAPYSKYFTIYAASATGGLWKTDNDGTTWQAIWDQGPTASIGDVTLAPSNPDIVWIGTGEANIFRSSNAGIGVYKSSDAGKTWQHMGLAGTYTIPRIVIHPKNPDIVFVAASGHEWTDNEERGVYKTIDGGKTWQKVLSGPNPRTGAIDLVMDPADPNTLYAAMWQRIRQKWNDPRTLADYTGSGIFKTTDGGKTWTLIDRGLPEAKFRGRIGLDVARTKPHVVYAYLDNYEIARQTRPGETDAYGRPAGGTIKGAEIYRSDDKGRTWRKVSEPDAPATPRQDTGAGGQRPQPGAQPARTRLESASGTYGWVFGQIRVDPNDENTVYLMGLGLNRSTDGGKTFYPVRGMHSDLHALWIDPTNSNVMVNGNDGGLVVTYDKGKTWRSFTSGPSQLPLCQFFNVSYDMATPFHVYGSMQDHGSYRGEVTVNRGPKGDLPVTIQPVEFSGTVGGEGSTHAVNVDDNVTVYASSFYGNLDRADTSKPMGRRGGPGNTANVAPKPEKGELPLRGQWLAPTILSPFNQDIVYHGMQFLFRSVNRGDAWDRISPDLTLNDQATLGDIPYHTLFAISESPKKFGLIYAGTDDGRAHVTKDGGKTWTEITKGLAPGRWMSRIVASQYDLATVYLTQNGKRDDDFTPYVWKSTDYGATWTSIVGNIPLGPVNVIREDPTDAKILYVGTDTGVYVSHDGGGSWEVLGGNLPSVYVHDLVVHPRDKVIVIATHGRGMWLMDAGPVERYKK